MSVCTNPNCRRGVDPRWSFCPMCGIDNRPPIARRPIQLCRHLFFQGAGFCPICGQPVLPVISPQFLNAPNPFQSQRHSKTTLNPFLIFLVCSFGLCIILGIISRLATGIRSSQPPEPCRGLEIGMNEARAIALMGNPDSRKFQEATEKSSAGWNLVWAEFADGEWQSTCEASFANGRLETAQYLSDDTASMKWAGWSRGNWTAPQDLKRD